MEQSILFLHKIHETLIKFSLESFTGIVVAVMGSMKHTSQFLVFFWIDPITTNTTMELVDAI